jgi:hypothetical protein
LKAKQNVLPVFAFYDKQAKTSKPKKESKKDPIKKQVQQISFKSPRFENEYTILDSLNSMAFLKKYKKGESLPLVRTLLLSTPSIEHSDNAFKNLLQKSMHIYFQH